MNHPERLTIQYVDDSDWFDDRPHGCLPCLPTRGWQVVVVLLGLLAAVLHELTKGGNRG